MNEAKKVSRRSYIKYVGGVAAAAVVAAAGYGVYQATQPTPSTPTVATSTPTVATSTPTEKVTLRTVFGNPEPLRNPVVEDLLSRFQSENPDITVENEFIGFEEVRSKLLTYAEAGTLPDLMLSAEPWQMGVLSKWLEDLTDRVKALPYYGDIPKVVWDLHSLGDKITAVPWGLYCDFVFYRTDRVKEVGLPSPTSDWTWDDFLTYAKKLTRTVAGAPEYGFGMRGAGVYAIAYATSWMYSNGGKVFEDGKVTINSPECVDAYSWYVDLFKKHKVCPPSAPTDGYRGIVEGFGRGLTSMYCGNSGHIAEQKTFLADKFATIGFPFGPAKTKATFLHSECMWIFNTSKHIQAAWRLVKWLMDQEEDPNKLPYIKITGLVPPSEKVAAQFLGQDPAYNGWKDMVPYFQPDPYTAYPAWGGIEESIGVPLHQAALLGQISPKEALDQFAAKLQEGMTQ